MSPKKRGQRPPPRKTSGPRQQRPPATTRSSARPTERAPFYTPKSTAFRRSVERTSAPLLVLLKQMPRWVVMFTPLVLVLLGFFLPLAVGLIFLGLFFLLTSWLAYLSWPVADARARVMRLAMFALVLAAIVFRVARG